MRSVSRHLDPPQADLDNGSVVLQHLTLSVSVCVCAEWSFVWPGLLCHLARSLERQAQAICSLSHCHHTDAVIVKVPHLTDLSAPLLELCFPFQPLEGMYAGSLANCAFSCSCSLLLCRMIKSKCVLVTLHPSFSPVTPTRVVLPVQSENMFVWKRHRNEMF